MRSLPINHGTRVQQRDATRAFLLRAAVDALIEHGVRGTTTLAVQQRAGVGRGTLLHHFPTHAQLLAATVAELVRLNEEASIAAAERMSAEPDPLVRAVRTLATVSIQPSYAAELELWAVARTDPALHEALRTAERLALRDRRRVIDALFEPLAVYAGWRNVAALTVEFLRGIAMLNLLEGDSTRRERLLADWIDAARHLLQSSESVP